MSASTAGPTTIRRKIAGSTLRLKMQNGSYVARLHCQPHVAHSCCGQKRGAGEPRAEPQQVRCCSPVMSVELNFHFLTHCHIRPGHAQPHFQEWQQRVLDSVMEEASLVWCVFDDRVYRRDAEPAVSSGGGESRSGCEESSKTANASTAEGHDL